MKKIINVAALAGVIALGAATLTSAQGVTFTQNLTLGSTGPEVVALQQRLVAEGHLVMPAGVAMGYFGNLTKAALAKWQVANTISPALGYFGPLSRGVANSQLAQATTGSVASISNVRVQNTAQGTGATILANSRTITWQTNNFPVGIRVDINLIKKTSDSPASYTFVRSIAKDTVNDGAEIWVPQAGETSGNMYIEVVCPSSGQLKFNCKQDNEPAKVN